MGAELFHRAASGLCSFSRRRDQQVGRRHRRRLIGSLPDLPTSTPLLGLED